MTKTKSATNIQYYNICKLILQEGHTELTNRGPILTYNFNYMPMFKIVKEDINYDSFKIIPKKLIKEEYKLIYKFDNGPISFKELKAKKIGWYETESMFVKSYDKWLHNRYGEQIYIQLHKNILGKVHAYSKNILIQFKQEKANMPICIESIQLRLMNNGKFMATCIQRSSDLSLGWFFDKIHIYWMAKDIVKILNINWNTNYKLSHVNWYLKNCQIYKVNADLHNIMLNNALLENNFKNDKHYKFELAQ